MWCSSPHLCLLSIPSLHHLAIHNTFLRNSLFASPDLPVWCQLESLICTHCPLTSKLSISQPHSPLCLFPMPGLNGKHSLHAYPFATSWYSPFSPLCLPLYSLFLMLLYSSPIHLMKYATAWSRSHPWGGCVVSHYSHVSPCDDLIEALANRSLYNSNASDTVILAQELGQTF